MNWVAAVSRPFHCFWAEQDDLSKEGQLAPPLSIIGLRLAHCCDCRGTLHFRVFRRTSQRIVAYHPHARSQGLDHCSEITKKKRKLRRTTNVEQMTRLPVGVQEFSSTLYKAPWRIGWHWPLPGHLNAQFSSFPIATDTFTASVAPKASNTRLWSVSLALQSMRQFHGPPSETDLFCTFSFSFPSHYLSSGFVC